LNVAELIKTVRGGQWQAPQVMHLLNRLGF
jgi:hypothetical protein